MDPKGIWGVTAKIRLKDFAPRTFCYEACHIPRQPMYSGHFRKDARQPAY